LNSDRQLAEVFVAAPDRANSAVKPFNHVKIRQMYLLQRVDNVKSKVSCGLIVAIAFGGEKANAADRRDAVPRN